MIRILETARIPYALNDFSDPGAVNNDLTFTDCSDRNPYRVLEGALVAALAIGADTVIVGMKRTATRHIERVRAAWHPLLGRNRRPTARRTGRPRK